MLSKEENKSPTLLPVGRSQGQESFQITTPYYSYYIIKDDASNTGGVKDQKTICLQAKDDENDDDKIINNDAAESGQDNTLSTTTLLWHDRSSSCSTAARRQALSPAPRRTAARRQALSPAPRPQKQLSTTVMYNDATESGQKDCSKEKQIVEAKEKTAEQTSAKLTLEEMQEIWREIIKNDWNIPKSTLSQFKTDKNLGRIEKAKDDEWKNVISKSSKNRRQKEEKLSLKYKENQSIHTAARGSQPNCLGSTLHSVASGPQPPHFSSKEGKVALHRLQLEGGAGGAGSCILLRDPPLQVPPPYDPSLADSNPRQGALTRSLVQPSIRGAGAGVSLTSGPARDRSVSDTSAPSIRAWAAIRPADLLPLPRSSYSPFLLTRSSGDFSVSERCRHLVLTALPRWESPRDWSLPSSLTEGKDRGSRDRCLESSGRARRSLGPREGLVTGNFSRLSKATADEWGHYSIVGRSAP